MAQWSSRVLASIVLMAGSFLIGRAAGQGLPYEIEEYSERTRDPRVVILRSSGGPVRALIGAIGRIDDVVTLSTFNEKLRTLQQDVKIQSFGDDLSFFDIHTESQNFVDVVDIVRPGAAWLKLIFQHVDLGSNRLVISSPQSDQSQTFTSTRALKDWNWTSRLFFGSHLRVQLEVAGGDTDLRYVEDVLSKIVVGQDVTPRRNLENDMDDEHSNGDEEEPCGDDSRVPSEDVRVGRMLPVTCTVFAVEDGIYLTAGHCLREARELQNVHFNVPLSTLTGRPVDAATRDIYPLELSSVICNDCGGVNQEHGLDWAVVRLGRNSETNIPPHEAQRASFKIYTAAPQKTGVGRATIIGYGWDNKPPSANYAQQVASGELRPFFGDCNGVALLEHLVDTEQGSSGSPIVLHAADGTMTDMVIGIHTGGRCNPQALAVNKGTHICSQALLRAIEAAKRLAP